MIKVLLTLLLSLSSVWAESGPGWVSYPGKEGAKHVVLLAGDEEYRSEESLPMLAKILSERHGFKATVLFSIDAEGFIDPKAQASLGKPETLDSADALVLALRFRAWPDDTMKKFQAAVHRGVPIVALRTSTHPFDFPKDSPWADWGWKHATGGFGKKVLGETWVTHWGNHKKQATRAVIETGAGPIVNGVTDVFGDTDVYEVYPPASARILMRGLVMEGMTPEANMAENVKKRKSDGQSQPVNEPPMPVAWTRELKNEAGTTNKIMTTTMGSATDLVNEGLRRLVVNSIFWGLGMDVPEKADVTIVGEFVPTNYSFDMHKKGVKAADLDLK